MTDFLPFVQVFSLLGSNEVCLLQPPIILLVLLPRGHKLTVVLILLFSLLF